MSETINFGIDLGTTNSVITKFVKGNVEVFRDPVTWRDTLPSVVGFRKERILVGHTAKVFQEKDPKSVIGQFKRKMGTTETFRIKSQEKAITPVELSAQILKTLKTHVQTGEKVDAAVITVPASFDLIQSNATKQAAIEAGFKDVVLLQEPIAASLAYANHSKAEETSDGKWLVYDLGGGTFDVALVSIKNGQMKVIDHEGDNYLGGTDFDRMIIEQIIVPHLSENGFEVSMTDDLQSASGKYNSLYYWLLRESEGAKVALSSASSAEIDFEFEDEEISIEITRSDFESIIREAVDQTIEMVRTIMTRNRVIPADLDFLLMVGGSTFIPHVRERVGELIGVPVRTDIDPTTAIAIGAAYFAGTKERGDDYNAEEKRRDQRITIRSVYEKLTREDSELFAARVSGNCDGLFYKIVRNDGGFDTGLVRLTEKISEDLPLVKDAYNHFTFTVYDAQNNQVETNLQEIQIAHNRIGIDGQPLPEDICLELDDIDNGITYLHKIFSKSTTLPVKSPPIMVRANRNVSVGSEGDSLHINVFEGRHLNVPEANQPLGTLSIRGTDISRDIIKGSEIELRFEMSESRDLTVAAYVEHIDQGFSQIYVQELRSVDVDQLQFNLSHLRNRTGQEINAADERQDTDLARNLRALYEQVDELEDKALELKSDDVTDQKIQFDEAMRRLAQELNETLLERQGERLLAEYYELRQRCEELIAEVNNSGFRDAFAEVTAGENQFTNPPSVGILKTKLGELENLYWYVRWRSPKFLTDTFNRLVNDEDDAKNPSAYRELIEEGQIAIIDDNFDKLREIIFRMFDLLKGDRKSEIEGKTGISIF